MADLTTDLRGASLGARVLIVGTSFDLANLRKTPVAGADEILDKLAAPDGIPGVIREMRAGVNDGN